VNELLTWLLDAVQSVDPVLRTVLAGVAVMLETSVLIGLFVPGDTVVIIAGTAVASALEGVALIIAVIIGALIGESIGFWLGRYLGPRIRHSRLGRRIGDANWERSERYLRRRGGPAIFV
jgi:membrane-associated protein